MTGDVRVLQLCNNEAIVMSIAVSHSKISPRHDWQTGRVFSAAYHLWLADSILCVQPAGSLVDKCRTLDQARAVVTFLDAASEKTLRSTVALTAARGRGKSAALGLAIAGALALGYSNIFVTAPSPENLRTLFEFILKVRCDMSPYPPSGR